MDEISVDPAFARADAYAPRVFPLVTKRSYGLGAGAFGLIAATIACSTSIGTGSRRNGTGTVRVPAGDLVVDDGGSGSPPVLFVHGNGGNRKQWSVQLAHLRPRRRAIAFDLRGMGESERPSNADYSVEGFAGDVAVVADRLRLRRFVLVGHSFGGAVVAAYAGRHPDRLAGLVFADSAGDLRATPPEQIEKLRQELHPETYERFTQAWFSGILAHATEQTRGEVIRSLRATPREVFVGATMGLYEFPFSDSLARYRGPSLSIVSYLAENPVAVHRQVAGMPVVEIREASHWLMMDRPEQFNRILEDFLGSLPPEH